MRLQRIPICAIELVTLSALPKPLPGERNDRVDLHGRSPWIGCAPLIARTRVHVDLRALLAGLRCRLRSRRCWLLDHNPQLLRMGSRNGRGTHSC
jgi:hypothetical protein